MLIPYPDVPQAPGVPPLPQAPPGVSAPEPATPTPAAAPVPSQVQRSQYAILDTNGRALVTPDSVLSVEYRGEMKLCSYPVEQGSFSSYNKVYQPFDARVVMTCGGQGAMTRDAFLSAIEGLRTGLTQCVIQTPDAVYQPLNLVHYDYRRAADHGVSLLTVEAWFQEIRIAGQTNPNTAQPDGATASQHGQVAPTDASTDQLSAYNQTAIA